MIKIKSICFSASITCLLLPVFSYANTPIDCNLNQYIVLIESNASDTKVVKEAMRCADTTNDVFFHSQSCMLNVGFWADNSTSVNKKRALKYCKAGSELGDEDSAKYLEMPK